VTLPPRHAPDLVRVWIISADLPPRITATCRDVLDDGERARAETLRDTRDRRVFEVAHGALRILAARELNTEPSALAWSTGRNGKPELAGLHTNLSHSGELIAAAISTSRPVGVDVQEMVPDLDAAGLSARYFPPDEAEYVAAGTDARERAGRFARLWVRKEAVVKASGGRLWANLKIAVRDDVVSCDGSAGPVGPHRVADLAAPPGYRAAVALTGTAPFVTEVAAGLDDYPPHAHHTSRSLRGCRRPAA
jgi:4'-phosphopantetheinyl transferase